MALTPDVEKITGEYLRNDAAVIALVGDRVGGKHPRSLSDPWVKIVQIGDTTVGNLPVHLIAANLQFDCYGGEDEYTAHGEASELARTLRDVLQAMPDDTHEDAVVSDVKFGPMSRVPDSSLEPARERFILTATIYCHAD
jgi:hypothetical protein